MAALLEAKCQELEKRMVEIEAVSHLCISENNLSSNKEELQSFKLQILDRLKGIRC
jgi:hypothetical protein